MIVRFVSASLALVAAATLAVPVASATDDATTASQVAFGRSIAISGDHAFIGEPGGGRLANAAEGGAVWVFTHGTSGWTHSQTISGTEGVVGFGTAIAADGNLLLIGDVPPRTFARPGTEAPPEAPGVVHVYRRGANGSYTAAGTLPYPDIAGTRFGSAISIVGGMIYVGAPGEGNGTVHLFSRSGERWVPAGTIAAEGLGENAGFGSSISVDGNRVAIGAPGQDGNGAVYVFARGADGSWMMEGSALASRRSSDNAQFGSTVLLAGDRLMVGAPGANFVPQVAAQPEAAGQGGRRFGGGGVGMVVSFDRNANSGIWSEGDLLAPYDFPMTAAFGSALAMAGSELWVGAPRSPGSGDIYRVAMTAEGGVRAMAKLVVDSVGGRNAQFGASFAVAGDRAVVGMPSDIGGQGTVLFLERVAGSGWTTVGTAFPPTKDRFQMVRGKEIICDNGEAAEFKCGNTGLLAFLPTSQVGGGRGSQMSDNWGWTDPQTGREYALAGRNDGTAFVDITDPENPTYLGNLPLTPGANAAAWRDIKTYKNHAYVVADGAGEHGMQVFDLTRLRGLRSPQVFTPDYLYTNISSSHNIVINEETGFAYSVGSSGRETCGGGLHMINIQEPKNPKFVGCAAYEGTGRRGTGYSHDAVCIVYKGPDTKYQGHEICVGSNETAIAVQDVTDKANPVSVSSASYPFVAYAHQGWFTDDHKYFYLDDESDEISAQRDTTGQNMAGKGTRTMVYDMTDLDDPVLVKEYIGTVRASDHNLYVKGNKLYLSNYGSGLRIADISDPTNPREVAYLDTYPDDEDQPQMVGAWSVYPFFKSGTIIVTSVSEGLFLVKDRSQAVP